ncbi:MAG: hypothetical protein FJZ00_14015, partial [Candidatus Sericytochromatia bacterium]|nr:hypothetical protein [Candidatus Tanganyikabacteria bacterium]
RHGGVPYLYVADSDAQILIEINIQTGAVRKLAGVLPAANAAGERKAACYGAAENGADARQANLNFPYHMRFDHQERLVVIDMDNLLLRRIDPYSSPPRIWTIAGRPAVQDEACGQKNPRQTSGLEEGEARHVSIGMPNGMAFTADGHLYVADLIDSVIRKVWLGADR